MKTYVWTLVGVLVLSMGCSSTDSNLAHAGVKQEQAKPLPRLMGDTWQFFSQKQDKRAGYFKDKKAVEAYFKPLYQALKKRNPDADAKAAAERGQRLLLGMYYGPSAAVYTRGSEWHRITKFSFNDDPASFKRCGGPNYKRLEGTSNIMDCKGVQACEGYRGLATNYVYRFNGVMVSYCNKPVKK